MVGPMLIMGQLFTPASGSLFVHGDNKLFRSDDAGTTWSQVNLPPRRNNGEAVAVDPTDHRFMYADSAEGLQRSDDEGATWTLTLPLDRQVSKIAVSPADPRIVYAAHVGNSRGRSVFKFLRSTDRGMTWETLEEQMAPERGYWTVFVLEAHPTDPNRVYRSRGADSAEVRIGYDLEESRDQGMTWRALPAPEMSLPYGIVGGAGVEPQRLIAAYDHDRVREGSSVLTSMDDGVTWTTVLEYWGGGTESDGTEARTAVRGLAYDPTTPGRFFVGTHRANLKRRVNEAIGVRVTNDGGATWTPLGRQNLPAFGRLALANDRRYLYASTSGGVHRIALS